jgi:hypothetical protein
MSKRNPSKSRREFAKSLAIATTVPIFTTSCGISAPTEAQTTTATPINKAAKAMTDAVQAQYGEHINKDDLVKVQAAIERNFAMAEKIRQFKLKNSDEPAIIFLA